MDDQRVKLLIDFGLTEENARKIVAELDKMKASAKGVADTYEVLDRVTGTYAVATNKLQEASDKVTAAAVEQTRAQKLMAQMLDEMPAHTSVVTTEMTKVVGNKGPGGGMGGMGILNASYAMQDFVAVYSGGGGFGRALGSMANNVTSIALGLGAGVGVAGALTVVTQLVAAGVPLVASFFGEFSSDQAKAAEKRLEELKAKADAAADAFRKLAKAPTEPEIAAAKGLTEFLSQRPNVDRVRAALEAAMGPGAVQAAMRPEQLQRFRLAAPEAGMSDEAIERQVRAQGLGGATQQEQEAIRQQLRIERRQAQQRQAQVMADARRERANIVIQQAQVAGPEGEAARREVFGVARGMPGLEELTPDAIEARRERDRLTQLDNQRAVAMANARAAAYKEQQHRAGQAIDQGVRETVEAAQTEKRRAGQAIDEGIRGETAAAREERKAREKEQRDKFRAGTPSAAELHRADVEQLQQYAARLEQRAAQGGMTPAIARQLQRLQARLGKDFPQFAEVQAIQQMAQSQMLNNQMSFTQQLQEARRVLAQARRLGHVLQEQTMTPLGR